MDAFDPRPASDAIWAKSDRDGGPPVTLWEHGLAAGLCARVLLEGPLEAVARCLSWQTAVDQPSVVGLAAWMVSLHDLGKATQPFQALWEAGRERVAAAGLPFPPDHAVARFAPHGFVSAAEIGALLVGEGVPRRAARGVARAIGAHHGTFPPSLATPADDLHDPQGRWRAARAELAARLKAEFAAGVRTDLRWSDTAEALLAGLTTFADWLASDRDVVGGISAGGPAAGAVEDALARVPLVTVSPPSSSAFAELFPFAPRGAQRIVDERIVPEMRAGAPTMVIVEDATGAGKTEAAFQLAHAGLRLGLRGTYVALPTQATSNQAYRRLADFLAANLPGVSQAHLLHSGAWMTADYAAIRAGIHPLSPREVEADGHDDTPGAVDAAAWFAHGKRGLLGSHAVGTVDQAMVGVLKAKFATLRMMGLAGKTLILDEVHAYDAYMSSIIQRLVSWAGAMGGNVVILSATLPAHMKRDLITAFAGADIPLGHDDLTAYPSVTHVTRGGAATVHRVEAASHSRRRLGFSRVPMPDGGDPASAIVDAVETMVDAGAEVAVIVNTVARAQAVHRALRDRLGDRAGLFHARFRQRERQRREDAVREAYGPAGARPGGSVLVATQVIEQSLDLDFDAMFTDLAPIDLMLQRAGRLQRHDRRGTRPPGYDERACTLRILAPPCEGQVPRVDAGSRAVYGLHPLLRTWWAIEGRESVDVPGDVRGLIEAVYDDREPDGWLGTAAAEQWRASAEAMRTHTAVDQGKAGNRVVGDPRDGTLAEALRGTVGDDESPGVSSLAATRLGISCSVVILTADEAPRLADADARVPGVARALIERSLSLSHPALASALLRQPVPSQWRRVPLMCRHRLLVLDQNGECAIAGARLRLDRELGVEVTWPTPP